MSRPTRSSGTNPFFFVFARQKCHPLRYFRWFRVELGSIKCNYITALFRLPRRRISFKFVRRFRPKPIHTSIEVVANIGKKKKKMHSDYNYYFIFPPPHPLAKDLHTCPYVLEFMIVAFFPLGRRKPKGPTKSTTAVICTTSQHCWPHDVFVVTSSRRVKCSETTVFAERCTH
jgi:hypothetical protein